jgi:hypothetical protein
VVVLFLEPHGRKVTERRVQSAGVVYLVDEARKSRARVGMRVEVPDGRGSTQHRVSRLGAVACAIAVIALALVAPTLMVHHAHSSFVRTHALRFRNPSGTLNDVDANKRPDSRRAWLNWSIQSLGS